MKRSLGIALLLCLAISIGPFLNLLQAAGRPPQPGEKLPDLVLPALEGKDRDYLGVSGRGPFRITQVNSPVVLIQILSMYCPYCQKEAPNVNELYRLIEQDATLRGKIKIIGIGAGNSAYEVGLYRKKFNIPFPVIPDPDFAAYEKIGGEVRTPYFIAVKNQAGKAEVFYSAVGALGDPAKFLKVLTQDGGLK